MVRRDGLTGWTAAEWAEVRMWMSCTGLVVVAMAFFRLSGFLDCFRLFFFMSPFWLTLVVAPFQSDRNAMKLTFYGSLLFLVYWGTVHAYPSQCRHAWGTMMVSDTTFWDNATVISDAILQEKDTYYRVTAASDEEYRVYWPRRPNTSDREDPHQTAVNSVAEALKVIRQDDAVAVTAENARVRKWIEAWSGGMSLNLLKLRAYCNINQGGTRIPHVYPFRVLGILPNQIGWTMPCPYWSCLMTEARPKGKLVFFAAVGFAALLNYIHYRCDCACCSTPSWLLGAGQPRLWWWWFWAALLPLCLVMGIKTTYDEELAVVISNLFNGTIGAAYQFTFGPFSTTGNKLQVLFWVGSAVAAWYYRVQIRHYLGLDDHFFLPFLMSRHEIAEESKHSFQVCIWRVDINGDIVPANTGRAAVDPREAAAPVEQQDAENVEEAFSGGGFENSRSLMLCGSPAGQRARRSAGGWRVPGLMSKLYAPMFKRAEDSNVLTTADGRMPSLSVHFYYGMDEIQSTRTIKPTNDQWWNHDPVYFQENFKLSVEWRARAMLRAEVRDASATLGSISLGSVSFDEASLERHFLKSRNANPHVRRHSVPIMQVVQMSALPPKSPNAEDQQIKQLESLGFQHHRLTDGGAIWLAFYETEDNHQAAASACC